MLQGTVRALGIQKVAARHNLFAYWFINFPLCYLLSFWADLGFVGLWYSIILA